MKWLLALLEIINMIFSQVNTCILQVSTTFLCLLLESRWENFTTGKSWNEKQTLKLHIQLFCKESQRQWSDSSNCRIRISLYGVFFERFYVTSVKDSTWPFWKNSTCDFYRQSSNCMRSLKTNTHATCLHQADTDHPL